MAREALIVWGGWDGHEPAAVADLFAAILREEGFEVWVSESLDSLVEHQANPALKLIVPIVTMSKISDEQLLAATNMVASGIGLAGCHGGMCDAFRESTEWQFMTGGQWVAHPGNDGVEYLVDIVDPQHPITAGIGKFPVKSEQYYMHVDPAVKVLATTQFPTPGVPGRHEANGPVDMPVVWTKRYGLGRVFYCSLGHQRNVVEAEPAKTILRRGMLWAAKK